MQNLSGTKHIDVFTMLALQKRVSHCRRHFSPLDLNRSTSYSLKKLHHSTRFPWTPSKVNYSIVRPSLSIYCSTKKPKLSHLLGIIHSILSNSSNSSPTYLVQEIILIRWVHIINWVFNLAQSIISMCFNICYLPFASVTQAISQLLLVFNEVLCLALTLDLPIYKNSSYCFFNAQFTSFWFEWFGKSSSNLIWSLIKLSKAIRSNL